MSSTGVCISTLLFSFRIYIKYLSFNLIFILRLFRIETQTLRQRQQHLDKTQFAHSSLFICIGFALRIYLWPSLAKVLQVLIHSPLGVTRFLHTIYSASQKPCFYFLKHIHVVVICFFVSMVQLNNETNHNLHIDQAQCCLVKYVVNKKW